MIPCEEGDCRMLKNISAQKARDLMLQYPVSLQTECCRIGEA